MTFTYSYLKKDEVLRMTVVMKVAAPISTGWGEGLPRYFCHDFVLFMTLNSNTHSKIHRVKSKLFHINPYRDACTTFQTVSINCVRSADQTKVLKIYENLQKSLKILENFALIMGTIMETCPQFQEIGHNFWKDTVF